MALLDESARAAMTLGFFFARLPAIARRSAAMDREAARALVLAHAEHSRRIAGIEIAIVGSERVPLASPFVLVYNETSIAQDLANLEILNQLHVDNAVFAAEYGLIPFFERAAPRWGVVLLRRGHRSEVDRVLSSLVTALRSGERVSMAPQGRISPDGTVCHFKRGAFLVAIRAGVPVVPVAVSGGYEIFPSRSSRMRPGVMSYRIGDPVSTAGMSDTDAPALAQFVQGLITGLCKEAEGATPTPRPATTPRPTTSTGSAPRAGGGPHSARRR
jgi:1-acyl-sn-glycerol-3-phosphate acyltransferase